MMATSSTPVLKCSNLAWWRSQAAAMVVVSVLVLLLAVVAVIAASIGAAGIPVRRLPAALGLVAGDTDAATLARAHEGLAVPVPLWPMCIELAQRGATLVMAGRGAKLTRAAEEVRAATGKALVIEGFANKAVVDRGGELIDPDGW